MANGKYSFLSDWSRARIHTQLDELASGVQATLQALDEGKPCDVLLGAASDMRRQAQQAEATLLEYHLQACLLPEIHGLAEIGTAVARMAESRTGALIAVERQQSLNEAVRPGVPMDARLSAPVLESIFYPGNPLHDGGVIVRDERIVSAACVFPLAAAVPQTSRKLGTRHRAAIGLSQMSDALVIVVSEETGMASIALSGRLYTVADTQRLVDQIITLSGKA